MYEDDSPPSGKASALSQELVKRGPLLPATQAAHSPDLSGDLEAKLQRTAPGYAPRSADDLLDWMKERLLIPAPEWEAPLTAMERDHELTADEQWPQ